MKVSQNPPGLVFNEDESERARTELNAMLDGNNPAAVLFIVTTWIATIEDKAVYEWAMGAINAIRSSSDKQEATQ